MSRLPLPFSTDWGAAALPADSGEVLYQQRERLVPRVPHEEAHQPARAGFPAVLLQAGTPVPLGVSQGSHQGPGVMWVMGHGDSTGRHAVAMLWLPIPEWRLHMYV